MMQTYLGLVLTLLDNLFVWFYLSANDLHWKDLLRFEYKIGDF